MTKKVIILLFLLTLWGVNSLMAQVIKAEAMAGMNLTQVEGDEVVGFKKPGINLGLGAMLPLWGNWDLSFEISYTQKGSREGDQYKDTIDGVPVTGAYLLRLNYAEIPVLIQYTDKDLITFGAGFSFGRLVGVQEWEHGRRVETTTLNSGVYSKNDLSYLVDIRIKIKGPLKLALRYQNSITSIRTREFVNFNGDTWSRNQFNKVITLRLIYMFNEKSRNSSTPPAP